MCHNIILTNQFKPLLLTSASPRRQLYAQTLSKVRVAVISRMAKPEEVFKDSAKN